MAAAATLTPTRLRCEYLVNPIGIDVASPRLYWVVESKQRAQLQGAYRIVVSSSPSGSGDLWDSGKISSRQTTHVEYGGKALRSGQRAWWKVTVWDGEGVASTSKEAFWERGLAASDWKAYWIGMLAPDTLEPERAGVKWIWYPEGEPQKDAPAGDRWFRMKFELPPGFTKARGVIGVAVDDSFTAELNGSPIGSGGGWQQFSQIDVTDHLMPRENALVIKATNGHSRAGLMLVGRFVSTTGVEARIGTNSLWEVSRDLKEWVKAREIADIDGQPYGVTKWSAPAQPPPHLRREFAITKPVARARAYASAKGLYQLLIDGRKVGGGIFTPGWTDYRKRIQVQAYDITSLLKPGRHAVGMILGDGWYCGHVAWAGREQYGPKPMGLLQIEIEYKDGTTERIVTDALWKVAPGPIVKSDMVMGEDYDARLGLGNWANAGYQGQNWQPPDVEELDASKLVAQMSPTVEKIEELPARSVKEPTKGAFVFDLGQNMVGWARLKVKGKAGDKVTIRFAEMLNPDGTVYTANLRAAKATETYILKGGAEETYEPSFTFHGFRYVEVTGYPGKPDLDAIRGIVVGTNVPKTGEFESSNPMVNQLQHNIYWGMRGNYLEVPTDCPQRDERLGWMGDAQIFIRTATFNNDVASFMTKWTQDVVDAQTAEGAFSDVSPKILVTNDGSPAWGDAGVIVPWTIYLTYGDKRLLAERYDSMKAWVDYIAKSNPEHLWLNRRGNDYGDWVNIGADMPREVIATAYFAHSTDLVSRAARVLGKGADAAKYERLFGQIKAAFVREFVAADGRIKGDTQTCYLLALRFGLLPPEMIDKAGQRLVDDIMVKRKGHLSTGFVGVGHLTPTLTQIGRTDIAYKMLLNDTFPSWGYTIKQGATTIWERWDGWTEEKGFQDPGMNSFNHYAFGSIGEWMYAVVAGIDLDPSAPGYEKIVIRPRPGGGITWARGALDSVRGRIESSWKLSGGAFTLKVVVPANTTATVYVPAKDVGLVMEGKLRAVDSTGVKFLRMDAGSAVFEVGSGSYEFTAKR